VLRRNTTVMFGEKVSWTDKEGHFAAYKTVPPKGTRACCAQPRMERDAMAKHTTHDLRLHYFLGCPILYETEYSRCLIGWQSFKPRRNFSMDPVTRLVKILRQLSSWKGRRLHLDKTDASASFIPRLDDTLNVTITSYNNSPSKIYIGSIPIK
jgi:hypothetical protein